MADLSVTGRTGHWQDARDAEIARLTRERDRLRALLREVKREIAGWHETDWRDNDSSGLDVLSAVTSAIEEQPFGQTEPPGMASRKFGKPAEAIPFHCIRL